MTLENSNGDSMRKLAVLLLPLILAGCPWDSDNDNSNNDTPAIETPVVVVPSEGPGGETPEVPGDHGTIPDGSPQAPSDGNTEQPEEPVGTPDGDSQTEPPAPVPDPAPPSPVPPPTSQWQADMVQAINVARAVGRQCGSEFYPAAGPVTHNDVLAVAAQLHAEDMAINNYFDHVSLDGRNPGDRITDAGYNWRTYGENIAAGQRSVDEVMAGWLASPGHCANIMNPAFEEVGLGLYEYSASRYGRYWVQNFGTHK